MVRRIAAVDPIPRADAIEVATVTGWKVVIAKGEFVPGDLAVYCEIDSFLPMRPEYEFLRQSSLRRMSGIEGFRLRTIRLRGQLSQGLLLPAPAGAAEGDDVTKQLDIVRYEPPIPANLAGRVRGPWPPVPRTDEARIQNLPEMLTAAHSFYVTEKLDGSSATYVLNRENFFVCSRNLNLAEDAGNTFWRIARELDLEEKMHAQGRNFAVQGELIGPGVQGNRYKLTKNEVRLYSAFDIDNNEYLPWETLTVLAKELGMETVPLIRQNTRVQDFGTIEKLLAYADGPSALGGAPREGLVWRAENSGQKIGFKAISNAFLLATDN